MSLIWMHCCPYCGDCVYSVSTIDASPKTTPELEEALRIIRQGCDMSSFGDALTWQKMAREDRELPYRD